MAQRTTTCGTFVRDGMTRTAYTPAEAVALRFNGWMEMEQAAVPEPDPDADGPAPAAAKPKSSRGDDTAKTATAGGK